MTAIESRPGLMLVEDDAALATLIVDELETKGWHVQVYDQVGAARQALNEKRLPALLITDLRLPDGSGMSLVDYVVNTIQEAERPGIIVITAFGSVRQAVEALKAGADDFLTKPLDLEHFVICVTRVMGNRSLRDELQRFRHMGLDEGFHGMVGNSESMRSLCGQIKVTAHAQGPVLILGESGSGKELVARAVHEESERAEQPFLAVNCAGIPQELLESEFFGHAAGAFTGAARARKGLLQEADGGTLMLDEIGEMPLTLQAKLLRALQDGSMRPVGQDKEERVDVRIIAATHQDLGEQVKAGAFREDLYYRLETFTLKVPPLRERDDDLEMLAHRFLRQFAAAQGKAIAGFTPQALTMLRAYDFPGNVRELQNVIERAVAYSQHNLIQPGDLPERLWAQKHSGTNVLQADTELTDAQSLLGGPVMPTMDELQRRYAQLILERVDGNKRRAAALLGIGRRTLYRWLEEGD